MASSSFFDIFDFLNLLLYNQSDFLVIPISSSLLIIKMSGFTVYKVCLIITCSHVKCAKTISITVYKIIVPLYFFATFQKF